MVTRIYITLMEDTDMEKETILCQGDVMFMPIKNKTQIGKLRSLKAPENGTLILAEGEASGHAHAIRARSQKDLSRRVTIEMNTSGEFILSIGSTDIPVTHEEHNPVVLKAGVTYRVIRQRELNLGRINAVAD